MGLGVRRARADRRLGFVGVPMLAAALLIATPASADAPKGEALDWLPIPGRGGRVAEGTRLLSEYGG